MAHLPGFALIFVDPQTKLQGDSVISTLHLQNTLHSEICCEPMEFTQVQACNVQQCSNIMIKLHLIVEIPCNRA